MEAKRLILGTAGLGGIWGKVDPEESVEAILCALDNGIGAIDTAPAYGDAESLVGAALGQWMGSKPLVSSKVGRLRSYAPDEGRYDYSDQGMERSVEASLRALGVSTLDILFLHEPDAAPVEEADRIVDTMMRLRESGYAGRIGLGGNSPAWLYRYGGQGIFDVVMEFNRLNASNTNALQDTLPFCRDNGIFYFAASPLNMGLLGKSYLSFLEKRPDWLAAGQVKAARELEQIAIRHGMELPELAHRFLLSLADDLRIVIGASNRQELYSSIAAFEKGVLPEEIMTEIRAVQNNIGSSQKTG